MFARFFIERPIFANVIAVITILIGAISLWQLPIEQYPEITPPTVQVRATYPGANAQVVANTVAAPIEQQVNGVPDMLYMSSTSSDGSYSLTVTFEIGTNLDVAQVQVQNRLAAAEPILPEEVRRQGVTARKQSPNIILAIALQSEGDKYDGLFLGNYATLNLKDELSRVAGVGDVTVFGAADYSMRVWVDPAKLKARDMTTQDVLDAIREQNVQVAAGQVNQPPSPAGEQLAFQYTVTTLGRLSDVSQFEDIVVKTSEGNRVTRLKDVARVELGAMTYDTYNLREGRPTAAIGIFQLPGSNALEVAENVRRVMERLAKNFPPGLEYNFALDTTKFVEASIHEVYKTLLEAGVLVLIVIMVFLQDWRALLIPATTVPVTLIGAFFAMAMMGYTVNMLTLFGLVLAIGIVVDDAIVVVENAAHHIERGLAPKAATIKAMDEVLGPIIGITLVLMSVFLPSAFLGGITGKLYQQFALTIAATALISAINAMTLKPAQCALWMRPVSKRKNWFYRGFNAGYDAVAGVYMRTTRFLVRHVAMTMAVFAALIAGTAYWYRIVPTGFFPIEDQGYALVAVALPDAAAQPRTREVLKKIDNVLRETEGVGSWFAIGGTSFIEQSNAPNFATLFVTFKAWDERLPSWRKRLMAWINREPPPKDLTLDAMVGSLFAGFGSIEEAFILPLTPPPIRGLGVRGGFDMQVQDRGGVGREALGQGLAELVAAANTQTQLQRVNSSFRPGVPQIFVDVDREKVKMLDVPLSAVFSTLQASMGAAYVNDFNKFGRVYQVRVQAEQQFRARPEDIERLEVRSRTGRMAPLGTVAEVRESFGPQVINRYNLYPSASINGSPAPGVSTGQALDLMEQIAAQALPPGVGYEWSGISFQEKRVGSEAIVVFVMAVTLVYLVLAAQYESWFTPLAVILVVPLGVLGAIAATSLRGMDNNLFTQIGIVLIIALASKNAILIVEFATDHRRMGKSIREAAIEAARLRFRPILMTSFAFILGVAPLVWATGAGAAGQRALGTAVFGGMLASTILAVFFVPVFYVVFQSIAEMWYGRKTPWIDEDEELPLFAAVEPEPALAK